MHKPGIGTPVKKPHCVVTAQLGNCWTLTSTDRKNLRKSFAVALTFLPVVKEPYSQLEGY